MSKGLIVGALALLLIFSGIAAAIETYEPYSTATGRYVTPAEWLGGPWYHTGYGPYFGDNEQAAIKYFSNTSKLTAVGKDFAIKKNLSVTGNGAITGDLAVTGSISSTGGSVASGHFSQSLWLDSPYTWTMGTGTATYGGLVTVNTLVDNGSIRATNAFLTSIRTTGFAYVTGNAKVTSSIVGQDITSNSSIQGTDAFFSTIRTSGVALIGGAAKFGSTASFGDDVTINSSKALVVTTADKLTVAGVIVPTEIALSVNEGNLTSHVIFVADGGWKITSVKEIHSVVSANSGTFTLEREPTGVTVPGSGTNCLSAATTSLTSTTNTLVTPALSSTPADYTLANGEKLAIVAAGYTALCQGSVTIYLKRV